MSTRLEEVEAPRSVVRESTSGRVVVLVLALLAVWALVRTGPGTVPGIESHEAGARSWPTTDVSAETAYMLRVPLGQLVYQALPVESLRVFLALHVATLLGSGAVLVAWMVRRYGAQSAGIATAVLILSPLTAVLLEWLGIYDAFSMLTWVLLVLALPGHRALQVATAALAGAQNFEQVVVGLVLMALLPELPRLVGWRPWVPGLLVGAVVGRLALEAYLRAAGAESGSRVSYVIDNADLVLGAARSFLVNLPVGVASVLAGLWAFAVPALQLMLGRRPARLVRLRLVLVAALLLAVALLGIDHTRVMVLSLVPLLVAGALAIAQQFPTFGSFWRRPEAWLLVLVPPVVLFRDEVLPLGLS